MLSLFQLHILFTSALLLLLKLLRTVRFCVKNFLFFVYFVVQKSPFRTLAHKLPVQAGVNAVLLQQSFVGAALGDVSLVQH